MRRARITYLSAWHHVMNRGINKSNIFLSDLDRNDFLGLLRILVKKYHIRLAVYCLMNNHYHLLLQNTSGKLSQFMRDLNGQYGILFRQNNGGSGYVFQGRFVSTVISSEPYLQAAISYILLNPVRAGFCSTPFEYRWSSINEYFSSTSNSITDTGFIESLYNSSSGLSMALQDSANITPPLVATPMGIIQGEELFLHSAENRANRRTRISKKICRRKTDGKFKSVKSIISQFEKTNLVSISSLNLSSRKGQRLRSNLLVLLKDESGLTYSEIQRIPIFKKIKLSSFGHIYKLAKSKMD